MATNGISAILANIQNAFPNLSSSTIQFLMTFPSLFIVIFSFIATFLLKYTSKKRLIIRGLSLVVLAGLVSFIGYKSFIILMLGAAILGSGVGLCSSFAISLISDFFSDEYKDKVMGIQTAAANFGSMLMTFLGGLLATNGWRHNYFVYFLAIPGLICSLLYLKDDKQEVKNSGNIKECTYSFKICLEIILFMFFFYVGPTSIAMLFSEKGINNTSIAGYGSTLFLLGGTIFSLLFEKINKLLKDNCISYGFLALTIGFLLMTRNNIVLSMIGCFITGSSISFVMPKFMILISQNEKPSNIATATAMAMAASNIGTLIAPIFTLFCTSLLSINTVTNRVILASIICLLIFIIRLFIGGRKNGK